MKVNQIRLILRFTSPLIVRINAKLRLRIAKILRDEGLITLFDPNSLRHYSRRKLKPCIKKVHLSDGTTIFVNINDLIGFRTAIRKKWDFTSYDVVKLFPPESTLYIDIGANIGLTSIPIARLGYNTIAIEPNPEALEILIRNVNYSNFENLILIPFAIGSGIENILATKIYAPEGNIGAASLDIDWSRGANMPNEMNIKMTTFQSLINFLYPKSLPEEIQTVILKIDVEGYEDEALAGGSEFIHSTRPIIIFENNPIPVGANKSKHFWEILENYSILALKNGKIERFEPNRRYEDVLAVPDEKYKKIQSRFEFKT